MSAAGDQAMHFPGVIITEVCKDAEKNENRMYAGTCQQ